MWGGKHCDEKNESEDEISPPRTSRYLTVLEDGCDYINTSTSNIKANTENIHSIKLKQHRPAWLEQIILRMSYIPHVVQNSSYSAEESTGALPLLLDLTCGQNGMDNSSNLVKGASDWPKTLRHLNKPVLIGKTHPGGLGSSFYSQCNELNKSTKSFLPSGSHIIDYLRLSHNNMEDHVLFDNDDMLPYVTLIQEKLNYILLALRYGNDPAWEMVYRSQCIQASLDPNGNLVSADNKSKNDASSKNGVKSFFSLWTWYQAYSERSLSLYNLLPSACSMHPSTHNGLALELFQYNDYRHSSQSNHDDESSNEMSHQHHSFSSHLPSYAGVGGGNTGKVNTYRALEFASAYYTMLEKRITKLPESSVYFFGTDIPSFFDAVLFAHLAEAICDVHLVLVLAKHSRLVQYFQKMYDQYFGSDYNKLFEGNNGSSTDWIRENNITNALNAFNQVPDSIPSKNGLSQEQVAEMSNAIQLMQQLAVHCHDLDEALRDAAKTRLESGEHTILANSHRPIGSILYKWCVGLWEGNAKRNTDNNEKNCHPDGKNGEKDHMRQKWKKQMERMETDARNSDETWVMGVIVAMIATVLVSVSSRTK